jgi:aminopeptidase N
MRRIAAAALACLALGLPVDALADDTPPANPPARSDGDLLTETFAAHRRIQIESVAYAVRLDLDEKTTLFEGSAALDVRLSRVDLDLSIDLLAEHVDRVRINGAPIEDYRLRRGSFDIPARYLDRRMTIEVDYRAAYRSDGVGLHRTIDAEDGSAYLFTQFEPYYAHHVFPCFDQPDIKATFDITLSMPRAWEAVSNGAIDRSTIAGERREIRFARTQAFSPYLVFIGAGPYEVIEAQRGAGSGVAAIPLRLLVRKSLRRHLEADVAEIFDITRAGLEFFAGYFGHPYPFGKLDQIFVPMVGFSAMENVAAVTLSEGMIYRGPKPQSARDGRENTILHELAHMWFGNLVTMRWWNDLWLNESFATYLATLAQDAARGNPRAWQEFHATKGWAYWQDQLSTTHPVETAVENTDVAFSNFDGITYGKGAAAIKQLAFVAGEDTFRDGVRRYVADHAWGNAVRADFTEAIGAAAGRDLGEWAAKWLGTAGVNRVRPVVECDGARLARLALQQQPSASGTLSPHRTRVGLYRRHGRNFAQAAVLDLAYAGQGTEAPDVAGLSCPDLTFANHGDYDYALVSLDPRSVDATGAHLSALPEPFLRQMIWGTLYQMVRDQELAADSYLEMAVRQLAPERDLAVLNALIGSWGSIGRVYWRYLEPAGRDRHAAALEDLAWRAAADVALAADLRLLWFDFYLEVARTPPAVASLEAMLGGEGIPAGLTLDQDRRWQVLERLASLSGSPQVLARIAEERKRDPSDKGRRAAFAAEVAIPGRAAKERYFDTLVGDQTLPLEVLQAGMRAFFDPDHPRLQDRFIDRYFALAPEIDRTRSQMYRSAYVESMFPSRCTMDVLAKSRAALAGASLSADLKRAWIEANDELERCLAVRERNLRP